VAKASVGNDFDEGEDAKIHILVHDIKPPFLDGRLIFTKQQEAICPVKDPTADFAILAKKGSQLLREVREQRERSKSQKKFWDIAGSKMGDVLGVKKEESEEDIKSNQTLSEDGNVDYRASSQYATHMQSKSEPVSDFAKRNTIAQQRESLPIYR